MKRSEINQIIEEAIEFFKSMNFNLPPLAYFSIDDWRKISEVAREVFDLGLGWDVTDFGCGDFQKMGLILFTLRNGRVNSKDYPKPYAEKVMLVKPGQVTPYHFHWHKMEDIINRGGGDLAFRLYHSKENDEFDDTPVEVVCDGIKRRLKAGEELILKPGESLLLPQKLYHEFYGKGSNVLVGEVSMVNDDATDNKFYEGFPRFSEIIEDEKPKYLLCTDYQKFLFN